MIWLLFLLGAVHADWWSLSDSRVTGIRTQRDVSANLTIDQVTTVGAGLTNVLFKPYGYTGSSLTSVMNILQSNVQTLVIDLYWNDQLLKFQLCPVPFEDDLQQYQNNEISSYSDSTSCQVGLSLTNLTDVIHNYVMITNTNLVANLVVLLFNLHSINDGKDDTEIITYSNIPKGTANDTLPTHLKTKFENELFTPSLLSTIRREGNGFNASNSKVDPEYGFPKLFSFLFDEKKRVVPVIWNNFIPSNSTYSGYSDPDRLVFTLDDLNAHFFSPEEAVPMENDYLDRVSKPWRFTYDNPENPYTTDRIHTVVDYGLSPILNHTLDSLDEFPSFLNNTLWSWGHDQPANESISKQTSQESSLNMTDSSADDSLLDAYKCAAFSRDGVWTVDNCYRELPVACRNSNNPYEWILNTKNGTYFQAAEDRCTGDYIFTVPKSAIEQRSLNNYLNNIGLAEGEKVWIDMNSIAVHHCWVSGGPYASCAYQKLDSSRNLKLMLAPAAAFTFFTLLAIFLIRLKFVPVQDNRKHWKKLIHQFTENEKEGVPS